MLGARIGNAIRASAMLVQPSGRHVSAQKIGDAVLNGWITR
ncbi:MAG TPA: hypothetical protein VHC92_06940 [Rhodanobacteraceae bacterium]|nr:hypothetical protein [Rhodanobacteraceae bacterium]